MVFIAMQLDCTNISYRISNYYENKHKTSMKLKTYTSTYYKSLWLIPLKTICCLSVTHTQGLVSCPSPQRTRVGNRMANHQLKSTRIARSPSTSNDSSITHEECTKSKMMSNVSTRQPPLSYGFWMLAICKNLIQGYNIFFLKSIYINRKN